ncbi:aspartic peptidase A1 [Mycena filopes]|nr:aspartic peptidase A1 [Mycena filopes]
MYLQASVPFFALLATVTFAVSHAGPVKDPTKSSGMITLPLRCIQRDSKLPVELRHQQHIDRAERRMAHVLGIPGPTDAQLREAMERRAADLYVEPANNPRALDLAHDSEQLNDEPDDMLFVATVSVGTPSRPFQIIMDSGSGDFWVKSDKCTSNGDSCGNPLSLSEDSSSTFVNIHKPWSVTYGTGAAAGDIIRDTVVLAGMTLENHTFGVANTISSKFSDDKTADGLMGLSPKAGSDQRTPTPVQSLVQARYISSAITSYRLPRTGDGIINGEITFGAVDETKLDTNTLVKLNITSRSSWSVKLDSISVNGVEVNVKSKVGLMDTGTTLLLASALDAQALHAHIPNAVLNSKGTQWLVPCNTNASVALTFGGKEFTIDPRDLTFSSGGRTSGQCQSGIGVYNHTTMIFGGTFLKSVYLSTNEDDGTVTLAKGL